MPECHTMHDIPGGGEIARVGSAHHCTFKKQKNIARVCPRRRLDAQRARRGPPRSFFFFQKSNHFWRAAPLQKALFAFFGKWGERRLFVARRRRRRRFERERERERERETSRGWRWSVDGCWEGGGEEGARTLRLGRCLRRRTPSPEANELLLLVAPHTTGRDEVEACCCCRPSAAPPAALALAMLPLPINTENVMMLFFVFVKVLVLG